MMCRSIVQLRFTDRPATEEEIAAAARQFVRKVSGYRVPSRANQAAFEAAVAEIADATARLLAQVAPPDGSGASGGASKLPAARPAGE
jgi:hypothetical protein